MLVEAVEAVELLVEAVEAVESLVEAVESLIRPEESFCRIAYRRRKVFVESLIDGGEFL